MKVSRETMTGWISSLLVHGLLILIFMAVSIPEIVENQEFIEVIWGSPAVSTPAPEPVVQSAPSPADASPSTAVIEKKSAVQKPSQPVYLPERRLEHPQEESLPSQRTEKLGVTEQGVTRDRTQRGGVGDRETNTGTNRGEREQPGTTGTLPGSSIGPPSGTTGPGGDLDRGVSFSIQWMQGGTRRKISGDLPKYPAGTNVEAQIKILTVVLPDGNVKSAQPAQKANTALEDAAMKEVRFWKFEPLRPSQPQAEQTCVVTFLFTLR